MNPNPYNLQDPNQNDQIPQNPYTQNAYNPNLPNPSNPYGNPTNPYGNPTNPNTYPPNGYNDPTNAYQNQYYQQNPNQGAYPDAVATPVQPQPGTIPNNGYNGYDNNVPPQSNIYYQTPDKYDPHNINYQQVTVDQWYQIPCQSSEYSQYWDSPDKFEPETFMENTEKESSCNDLAWLIIFWINFAATLALAIYLIIKEKPSNPKISIKIDGIKGADIGICAGIGVGVGLVSNIIHFIFIACCSKCYLGCGMAIGLIYAILGALLVFLSGGGFIGFILPALYLVLLVIFYCSACKYIAFSSIMLKQSSKLLLEYPGIICFCIYQIIWTLIYNALFCVLIYFIQKKGIHPAVYLYVVFSYLWCTLTFEYVEYMTISGVASSWYFLVNTVYLPGSLVCASYKRAMGTSFGSAAFAGFVLAVIQFLEYIIQSTADTSSQGGVVAYICCILKCIAMCVLCILESCVSILNRFALIYCAAFGIPYIAACKRFVELECTRFIRVLMSSCIISNATTYNLLVYSIASALAGYGFGHLIFKGKDYPDGTKLMFKIFCCCFALLFTFGIFEVLIEPILTLTDTLMICFCEYPDKLKTTDEELYETMRNTYDTNLQSMLNANNNSEGQDNP